jgi:hypothetical protein
MEQTTDSPVSEKRRQGFSEYRKSGGSAELYSQTEIGAPPEKIWTILMDFAQYPSWNPFIREIRGTASVGASLRVSLKPPGARGMILRPVVRNVEPFSEFRWIGHFLVRGLLDGEHVFLIKALEGGRSLFSQREYFSGFLLPLFEKVLKDATSRGFYEMNEALRARAEEQTSD